MVRQLSWRSESFTCSQVVEEPEFFKIWNWVKWLSARNLAIIFLYSFFFFRITQDVPKWGFISCQYLCNLYCRYYSASIITMAGITDKSLAIWLSAATSSMNFLGTFLGLWLVERLGRRSLTLGSLLGTMLSLFVMALTFQMAYINSPKVTFANSDSHECFADS